jgi:acyl-coenzyme A synthetase/AMP-(fatty) acid ligase
VTANPVSGILRFAEAQPQATAILSASARLSYGEFGDAVRRTAAALTREGVLPGDVVGVRAAAEWAAVLQVALLHEGAISLHANDAVLAAHAERIDVLLDDSGRGARGVARSIDVGPHFLSALGGVRPADEPRPLRGADLARVVFSSGTTGRPKGVPFTVDRMLARTDSARDHWMPVDPFVCLLGPDTVSGFQTLLWSLLHGATYVLPGDGVANARLLAALAARSIKTSPARLADLLDAVENDSAVPALALERVQIAGSLLSSSLATRCEALLGVRPLYLYGSTEAGTITRGRVQPGRPSAVGRVVDDADLEIVDASGRVVEPGIPGAVRFRTPHMPAGYWGGDAEIDAPFRDGWFYPGDRALLTAEGELELAGRTDDLVNAGGSKVELAELDLWLAEMPLVSEIASFAFRDSAGLLAVGVAYAAARTIEPRLVHERAQTLLATVELRAVIRVDALPRNATGKVLRRELAELLGR